MRHRSNRKIALSIGLSIVMIGMFFVPAPAFADHTAEHCQADGGTWVPLGQGVYECRQEGQRGDLSTAIVGPGPVEVPTGACNLGFSFDLRMCMVSIANDVILAIAWFFLGIAGLFMDSVISASVLGFSSFIKATTGETGVITIAWTLIRDVLNMSFIFVLLYIGIRTILGLGGYQKLIPKIVLAGLLINFSFFFTSVLIDASNVITISLYNGIVDIGDATPTTGDQNLTGLAGAFMKGLQLAPPSDTTNTTIQMVAAAISIVVVLVAGFVFLAMGIMLLVRFIILIVLLITSPIAVISGILPQLTTQSQKWWKTLNEQLLFAPVFMLFMLLVVLITNSAAFRVEAITPATSSNSLVNETVKFLLPYALTIGMMITGLVTAKQFAGAAGKGLTSWAEKKAKSIAMSPLRTAQWAGGTAARQTIGWSAEKLGKKYDIGMGKLAQYDFKKDKGWKRVGAAVAGVATFTRADEKIRDRIKAVSGAKFGTRESLADKEKAKLERKRQLGQAFADSEQKRKLKEGLEASTKALDSGVPGAYDSEANTIIKDYIQEVGKLTDKKIEDMLAHDLSTLKKRDFAGALTARQLDVINKSDLISDQDKKEIRTLHEEGLGRRMGATKVTTPTGDVYMRPTRIDEAKRIIAGRPSDVAQLPAPILKNPEIARRLSASVLSQIVSGGKMSDTDRAAIRAEIERTTVPTRVVPGTPAAAEAARLQAAQKWLASDIGQAF